MIQVSPQELERVVETLVREAEPERIYLFGSQSRGDAREGSDIDLLVVRRKPFDPQATRFDEINRLYQALAAIRVGVDLLLYSEDEVRQWACTTNHVLARALREGTLLYERP